jgi:hypothetical protein
VKDLKFRCPKCGSRLTDFVVMSRDAQRVQPWRSDDAGSTSRAAGHLFAILEVGHDGIQWHPHWHVLLAHPGIDRQEIAAAFRQRFPGARRVQVQPFHSANPVRENVENCVGYAFKFDHHKWSQYASSQLFLWIRHRAALRAMCSVLRAEVKTYSPGDALIRSGSKSPISPLVGPMPAVV